MHQIDTVISGIIMTTAIAATTALLISATVVLLPAAVAVGKLVVLVK